MQDGFGTSPFVLPDMFASPGQSLENTLRRQEREKERRYEIDYRNRKDMEADEWRKLNLIQDLTDLSKYQTGSDVANAVGNKLMSDVFQKYTASSKTMSPTELQYNIQKDMAGIINGMGGIKSELLSADETISNLKKQFPSLDAATLYDKYRKDIVARRLSDDLSQFRNPMEVPQTDFDLQNPEFLSQYVTGIKPLRDYVVNPQTGEKRQVLKGTPYNYTEFTANVTPWMRETFDRDKLMGGMISAKEADPKLELKSSKIGGLDVIDEDVYKLFNDNFPLEVKFLARKEFPEYDSFDARKKQLAERSALDTFLRATEQNQYYPSQVKTPSASIMNFFAGGSRSSGVGGGRTTGNAFDDMANAEFKNFDIRGGRFYNKDGSLKSGKVFITGDRIPASVKSALNAGGINDEFLIGGVDAVVEDGKIQSISNRGIGTITRKAMENVYQPKLDTEPLKGQKLKFSEADNEPPSPKPKGKIMSAADFKKLSLSERQKFLNEGGKVQ